MTSSNNARPSAWLGRASLVLLATLAVACASNTARSGAPGAASQVAVQVENHNRRDVAVYVIRSGARSRLGTTTAGGTSRFRVQNVRQESLADFRLSVAVIGSGEEFTTGRIPVSPGQLVVFDVQDLLSASGYTVNTPVTGALSRGSAPTPRAGLGLR